MRRASPEAGTVLLNAYHEGGHIIIEITDDGRGIDIERVKQKAVANGMLTEAEAETISDQQAAQLIFRAGLSTAEKVTNVSGRGVGMDVVKTNIEKIGGNVELKTVRGKGSTFIIKIPLTLAIVSALIVQSAGERFAIPQISVVELVRASDHSEHKIERINSMPVLRLRDHLLPLISLANVLALTDENGELVEDDDTEVFVIVCKVGTFSFGIMVDQVFDTEEIVVKPVAPILRDITMFSGNTILGDGSVVMILDPNGLASAVGEVTASEQHQAAEAAGTEVGLGNRMSLLVFRAGGKEPKAVPLSLVARLEEIDLSTVEASDGRPVVQYRGQLMPLVTINDEYGLGTEGSQPVVVFTEGNRTMGLVVDEIVDIVEDEFSVEMIGHRPGLIGTAVVAGKTTDVIDVGYYITRANGDWYTPDSQRLPGGADRKRVLLIDDSAFFRNLLSPVLSVAGYDVTTVESGEKALSLRENGETFDVIVSDIEMPGIDGFEFARQSKSEGEWVQTPIIALSSHTTPEDFDRGRDAGFDDYVAKFDRDGLLESLSQTLSVTSKGMA